MGSVSNMLDTYDGPNYVGELFEITPSDTPFLSMIGGLTGGKETKSKQFTWQTVDNNTAAQTTVAEGIDATFGERTRSEVINVTQIMQYGIWVSYTKQAAVANLSGQAIMGTQPVQNEVAFQTGMTIKRAARDIEYSFLRGTYVADTDVTTARGTRGMGAAITTNVVAAGSVRLNRALLQSLFKAMADSGAPFENVVLFVNSFQKQLITDTYAYAPMDRNVGGVAIKQIETDFGNVGVVFDRHQSTSVVGAYDVAQCAPVFLNIPGKGHFFVEPLAKAGAYDKFQLYGEIGLEYGPELWHGQITGLATS